MKRFAFAAFLLLVPLAAQAFDPEKPNTVRIAILRDVAISNDRYGTPVRTLPVLLRQELRRAGFDAYTLDATIEELQNRDDRDADFYIEVEAADHYNDVMGGVDVYGRNAGVSVGVVATNIDARVNVYDGQSFELYAQFDCDKSRRTVAPTSVGIGGRHSGLWMGLAIPFNYLQYRNVAREVAKTAAVKVADAVRNP